MSKELVEQKTPEIMEWVLDGGEKLQFTLDDAKNIAGNPNVTAKEFYMLCKICAPSKLNPFLKDAFLIKYGNNPAQIITGKNSALKIASRNKNYNGFEAGIIIIDKNKKTIHREGCMVYEDLGETLVGGWGRVFKKDGSKPAYIEVSLKEYIGKTKDGSTNKQWREKPATMIRKVGFAQSHREGFPEDLSGIYDESEIGAIENARQGDNQTTNSKVANIFSKDEDVIEGEVEEVTEPKPDVLLNELKIYMKALKITPEIIKKWTDRAKVSSIEELNDETKQKCIDSLKPKYEALQKEKKEKPKEKLKQDELFHGDTNPFND